MLNSNPGDSGKILRKRLLAEMEKWFLGQMSDNILQKKTLVEKASRRDLSSA